MINFNESSSFSDRMILYCKLKSLNKGRHSIQYAQQILLVITSWYLKCMQYVLSEFKIPLLFANIPGTKNGEEPYKVDWLLQQNIQPA